ncbi:MAG: 50S ribosomal protein L23 [Methylovulum sp.]|uniref:50S ribosomal protein L23 n=1 Tax=Methylovulum sp. TaxID=1916980 RepID=UPI0026130628|nr:50S ribosomal protein L23 [Methylovulum sp.]MDD2723981.1 50S ribosomal protein L23 [Methylovulum sp.]MDD5124872.1 50S ribosomal protein L23 [Methylovulum sp.]
MNLNSYQLANVLLAPVISEKSANAAENNKQFVFRVEKNSTKDQIKNAVEVMFSVEVDTVNILNVKGKQKKSARGLYKKSDWKKAYVKLKDGFDIEFSAA